jgi:hypothetical protein
LRAFYGLWGGGEAGQQALGEGVDAGDLRSKAMLAAAERPVDGPGGD